jgi:hypothetical protein
MPVREDFLEADDIGFPGLERRADRLVPAGQARARQRDAARVQGCQRQLLTGHLPHPRGLSFRGGGAQ